MINKYRPKRTVLAVQWDGSHDKYGSIRELLNRCNIEYDIECNDYIGGDKSCSIYEVNSCGDNTFVLNCELYGYIVLEKGIPVSYSEMSFDLEYEGGV